MIPVPTVGHETRPWSQGQRGGSQADRMLTSVTACVPGLIAGLSVVVPPDLVSGFTEAERKVIELDVTAGPHLAALTGLLLRTESVGSSRIENIDATSNDLAQALHGSAGSMSAESIVAASRAMQLLLVAADKGVITVDDVLAAHRELMRNDRSESTYAGRFRDMQNWIGGSNFSPRNADFVPPPADRIHDLMDNLMTFIARQDIPIFVQAAIMHAQFETIHPFTDGNGRIGRALVNALLRLRGVTQHVVVPMASALVASRDKYFADLATYRDGDVEPLSRRFAQACLWASHEALSTGKVLANIQETWHAKLGRSRANSAHMKLLPHLLDQPVVDAAHIQSQLDVNANVAYNAIERLLAAGILHPASERKRDQIWVAGDMMNELLDLDDRIHMRIRNLGE